VQFWADHFSVEGRNFFLRLFLNNLIDHGIRPNITGNFGDLLVACSTHPAMQVYLNQARSIGPNSAAARKSKQGLNENLAREILELHALGVGGAYTQTDVRQLAELLTGLTFGRKGRTFQPARAEPGPEKVLGKVYSPKASMDVIEEALQDIALHPDTARHIARKLVVHFVSDTPDASLVNHIASAYTASRGNLRATYEALLEHPAAWEPVGMKVKQPWDLVISGYRALGIDMRKLLNTRAKGNRPFNNLAKSLISMGQTPRRPAGPDGWPEDASYWITPATMAARIDWASSIANQYAQEHDPRAFLDDVLADAASPVLRAVVAGAEVRWEGVALVLASPEFNRR